MDIRIIIIILWHFVHISCIPQLQQGGKPLQPQWQHLDLSHPQTTSFWCYSLVPVHPVQPSSCLCMHISRADTSGRLWTAYYYTFIATTTVVNPWRMCEGYSSHYVSQSQLLHTQGHRSWSCWSGHGLTTFLVDLLVLKVGKDCWCYVHIACPSKAIAVLCSHNLTTNDGPDHSKFASYGPDTWFYALKTRWHYRLFMAFSTCALHGLHWKHFVQKFWWHLLDELSMDKIKRQVITSFPED